MPAYLKIENIGVCPPEGFTVLGVSLADTSDNQAVIGQFGSGNKHGVAVCLRNEVSPVVFCGSLRLDFFTKPQTVADSKASKDFARVASSMAAVTRPRSQPFQHGRPWLCHVLRRKGLE